MPGNVGSCECFLPRWFADGLGGYRWNAPLERAGQLEAISLGSSEGIRIYKTSLIFLVIAVFNDYVSVAKDEPFKIHVLEMTGLSLGVAAITFVIGLVLRKFLGVEV